MAVIAVAVTLMPVLMPVLVFGFVLLVVVFVLALLVLMFVGTKGTAEDVRDSHVVLLSFFTGNFSQQQFGGRQDTTTRQFDVSLGNFLP